jgi:hypothetical protein
MKGRSILKSDATLPVFGVVRRHSALGSDPIRITVLHLSKVLPRGSIDEIVSNRRVAELDLGYAAWRMNRSCR